MSDAKLAVVGMLAVVMAGWAIFQNRMSRQMYTTDYSSSALIEGLSVEAIASVRVVSGKGGQSVELKKGDGGFVVADKEAYPADVSKINDLITRSLDIWAMEKVTSDAANHADLGVTEETAETTVKFLDADGGLIVGYAVSRADDEGGAFARLLNSDDVYAIQNVPRISSTAMEYIDAALLSVKQEDILSVAVQNPQETYRLSSPEDSDVITLETIPAGQQPKGTAYQSVFRALTSLRFDDVMRQQNLPEDAAFDYVYTCKLRDKTVYKVLLAKSGEKTYAKLSADYLDSSPVTKENRVESEDELKEKADKLLAIDAVNTFNQKHDGWVYTLPSYQASELTKSLSELVEDSPAPADPNAVESTETDSAESV